MPLPAFKQLSFTEVSVRLLEALQENIARVLDVLVANPTLSGRILEDVGDGLRQGITLTAGVSTPVSHGLDRALRGWKLIDNTADARVWRDTTNTLPNQLLLLQCSANTTVKLEVF